MTEQLLPAAGNRRHERRNDHAEQRAAIKLTMRAVDALSTDERDALF